MTTILNVLRETWEKIDTNIKAFVELKFPKEKSVEFYQGYSESLQLILLSMCRSKSMQKELLMLCDGLYLRTMIELEQFKILQNTKTEYIN